MWVRASSKPPIGRVIRLVSLDFGVGRRHYEPFRYTPEQMEIWMFKTTAILLLSSQPRLGLGTLHGMDALIDVAVRGRHVLWLNRPISRAPAPSRLGQGPGQRQSGKFRRRHAGDMALWPARCSLIAAHPEETRVVVVRGKRIEEFDYESAQRRQLKGNIYLAKVTRVEPSLQAAFVDYGGNRHGFLAFSEIHPDYYQIPVADRQALLEEEERTFAAVRKTSTQKLNQAAARKGPGGRKNRMMRPSRLRLRRIQQSKQRKQQKSHPAMKRWTLQKLPRPTMTMATTMATTNKLTIVLTRSARKTLWKKYHSASAASAATTRFRKLSSAVR